jgi:hypothetical protein
LVCFAWKFCCLFHCGNESMNIVECCYGDEPTYGATAQVFCDTFYFHLTFIR